MKLANKLNYLHSIYRHLKGHSLLVFDL